MSAYTQYVLSLRAHAVLCVCLCVSGSWAVRMHSYTGTKLSPMLVLEQFIQVLLLHLMRVTMLLLLMGMATWGHASDTALVVDHHQKERPKSYQWSAFSCTIGHSLATLQKETELVLNHIACKLAERSMQPVCIPQFHSSII